MLSLRKESDYALQLLKRLSVKKGSCLSLQKVSEDIGVSFLFLQKIARKLRIAGMIEARQGIKGGYRLLLPQNHLSLRKIIQVMEGECAILSCLKKNCACVCRPDTDSCILKKSKKIKKLNKDVLDLLEKVKLSDI